MEKQNKTMDGPEMFWKHNKQGIVISGFDEMKRVAECTWQLGGIQWFTQCTVGFDICELIPKQQSPQVLKLCSIFI